MAWDGVLVRYGEIGIKSAPVRRRMTDRLHTNLEDALMRDGVEGAVQKQGARLWMAGPDPEALARSAQHVFGVVSVSPARRLGATMQAMGEAAAEMALGREWSSFAVRPTREGEHAFSSTDVGREVGSAVYVARQAQGRDVRVDLGHPDLEVHVEVRGAEAYVFTDKLPGPGGLPVGTQGRVVALVSDAPSLLAAWLMMRRGCLAVAVHAGSEATLPRQGLEALARWGLKGPVHLLRAEQPPKRALLEAATRLAGRLRCDAVVTGDGISSRLPMVEHAVVLRPVCGLLPSEAERWRRTAGLPELAAVTARVGDVDAAALLAGHGEVPL